MVAVDSRWNFRSVGSYRIDNRQIGCRSFGSSLSAGSRSFGSCSSGSGLLGRFLGSLLTASPFLLAAYLLWLMKTI